MLTGSQNLALTLLGWMATVFIVVVGAAALALVIVFVRDITQNRHAIHRNFPVIGHMRSLLELLGRFFRRYLYAMDREELPFNRAERSWVYSAARNRPGTAAFGSTKDIRRPGTIQFNNCPFPTLDTDSCAPSPVTIGPHCARPYNTSGLFHVSALSYGALSRPAIQALSRGAERAGCWLNTGEGGLSPYHLEGDCDLVFQIGTAKYGVRGPEGGLDEGRLREVAGHERVRMFELKLAQGAKPGKGGILPGVKVTPEIARIRGIPPYRDAISPNRHPEVDSVPELLDMMERVREVTGKPTGFKMVMGDPDWLDTLAAEIHRRGPEAAPDFITLDGAEGGSGAAPMSLMDNMGMARTEALPILVEKLDAHGLRPRVRVIASGKMVTAEGVAWALAVGADFVASGRGFMFALGCIQSLRCDQDTCPTGITTHNPRLQKGLDPADKGERVRHYVDQMTHEVGTIAHACGVHDPRELKPKHVRLVTGPGRSVNWGELFERRGVGA
ncbi:glutamate synthase [Thiohalorhabdus denitrificans]|uniref:Glutamate synthase domain-containing protein 2 n=1 Tax=Thiohalorhabdus denitrificans TaxID=381306 RepID=A0A0P9EAQ9_9GAMM|nr:FMN-binding glutamate synthase family protein [Thiohalorhabdus denitrificans]KPV39419.1 glutamate synthase [Thiohalorhabdus denitrificans]SCY03843.1 Glutamate synthase domain-containing protein 2 [Thiohalorhabdus denitrificans]